MYNEKVNSLYGFRLYLCFILLACFGAFVWQLFIPNMAESYSSWGSNRGWQSEIALWNIGIISAIFYTFMKKSREIARVLTLQGLILFFVLGINHLLTLIKNYQPIFFIHWLGIFEVLIIEGIWGLIVFIRNKKNDYC